MRILTFFFMLFFLAGACTEIGPVINPDPGGPEDPDDSTAVGVQQRQVLIEEFTGVRCVNCPAGAAAIRNLLGTHKEQLWVVSIHAGFFSRKYSNSKYDFRTTAGDNLLSYLGEPLGYPTAVVNRRLFDGEPDLQLGQPDWAGYVVRELRQPPKVRIGVNNTYDVASRALTVVVNLEVMEDVPATDVRLSIALTESGVMDVQLTPDGERADYIHDHVLRNMLSNFDGNALPVPLTKGQKLSRSFRYTLNPTWAAEKCEVLAFVHLGGEQKDVLQVNGAKVVE